MKCHLGKKHFSALQLAEIYHHYRNDDSFARALCEFRPKDGMPIPTLSIIIRNSIKESSDEKVVTLLFSSARLVQILCRTLLNSRKRGKHLSSINYFQDPTFNPYAQLKIKSDARVTSIRNAYLNLALALNPAGIDTIDITLFKKLSDAYQILSNPAKRLAWDREHSIEHLAAYSQDEYLTECKL